MLVQLTFYLTSGAVFQCDSDFIDADAVAQVTQIMAVFLTKAREPNSPSLFGTPSVVVDMSAVSAVLVREIPKKETLQ